MTTKARHTAKRTVRARHTDAAAVRGEVPATEEAEIDEAYFDKVMHALLQVPWSAKEWRRGRRGQRGD